MRKENKPLTFVAGIDRQDSVFLHGTETAATPSTGTSAAFMPNPVKIAANPRTRVPTATAR